MAKRIVHRLIDDLDGQPADETITFGLDGVHYEIDLTASNADRLRRAVAPFVAGGTNVGRAGVSNSNGRAGQRRAATSTLSAPRRTAEDRERLAQIRAWAHANGHHVKDRGRIPVDVIAAFERASTDPATPSKRTRQAKTVPPAQFTAP